MKPLKETLQHRAGLAAFATSAVVFGLLSVLKSGESAHPSQVLVPVMKKFVAAGSRVRSGDIRWVNEERLHPVKARDLGGFAKVPLFPGEVLSPQNLGRYSQKTVLVAVAPTHAVDARVARAGSYVDVLVANGKGVDWQSGPLPVVSRSSGGGAQASIEVSMDMKQAMTFERVKSEGTIELVGMTS